MTFPRYGVDRDFNFFIGNVRSLYYRPVRWNVWVFRRSFSVFVQYFRRVFKDVDNEQVRKPTICDVFVCKHWKEIVGIRLGELEGNRENFPSWAGKRECDCLPLTIVFWKLLWKVSGTCLFGSLQLGTTGHLQKVALFFSIECSKRKFVFHFLKSSVVSLSGRPSQHFFGNGNRSLQIVRWKLRLELDGFLAL